MAEAAPLTAPRIALVGNPNCGKTALFNALTGSRQKVANYPGVTVERKEGMFLSPAGHWVRVLDLPGTYSLRARSPDEAVTRDVVLGRMAEEAMPDALVCVADATNLRLVLRLVLELKKVGRPILLALNMMDIARHRGHDIDIAALSRELGVPVVPTVAVRKGGIAALLGGIDALFGGIDALFGAAAGAAADTASGWSEPSSADLRAYHREAERILRAVQRSHGRPPELTERIDRVVLHPVLGVVVLLGLLFLIFQAVFTWARPAQDLIQALCDALQQGLHAAMAEGPLRSLLADGVIAGVGSVLVFLPQILILFFFIILLEDCGYMARAAFLMDRVMGGVGLHGRAFIPLLSSFACAIPGIMAARTIEHRRDRLTTILIAPLMTCSARIPVYTLVISAFIPNESVWGPVRLQGLVMFALYAAGILSALAVAFALKRTVCRGAVQPLLLELPAYKLPHWRNLVLGLWERARMFLRRAGTIILALMVVIWFLATFPGAPAGAADPAINYSVAGMLGHLLAPLVAPIGFTWQIAVALIPGLAAREVAVAALGTVYALSGSGGEADTATLASALAASWSLPTALALLAWYVFAPQCASTLAVTKRETNSWRWPLFMTAYMLALAYAAAFVTFHVANAVQG